MHDENASHITPEPQAPTDGASPGAGPGAERRRQLLRAVAASGALVGAGVPLSAQASTRPYCRKASSTTNYHATASAVGSIIGSVAGGTQPHGGHRPAHYCSSGNWVACNNGGSPQLPLTYNNCANTGYWGSDRRRFYQVFQLSNPGSGPRYEWCAVILNSLQTSDEAHWLTALLNATKRSTSFPYTPTQVLDLYQSKNPYLGGIGQTGLNAKALTLFKDYLSQLT